MNPLKARLAAGETIKAAWAELGSPDAAEIMVRHGWNTIIIDGEHGIGDLEIWVAIARAIEALPHGHVSPWYQIRTAGRPCSPG